MVNTLVDKPLFSLTVAEFLEVMNQNKKEPIQVVSKEFKPVRGIHGLAKFLGVSPVTAQKLKNSGKISFSQYGRVILFDGDAVLKAMAENNQPKKR